MTQAQRFMLFIDEPKRGHVSLFTQACRAQGWPAKDRNIRLRVFGVAVSFHKGHFKTVLDALREITNGEPLPREITSASQLDNRRGCGSREGVVFVPRGRPHRRSGNGQ